MSDTVFTRVMLTLLLLLCAVLLYLDWMRQAEIEGLHMRVDELTPPRPLRTPPASAPPVADDPLPGSGQHVENAGESVQNELHPLVQAALQAHTDGELSSMGRPE